MARRSLRPHLNQIRTWVRQGRTDAWIAHQLEVTVQQITSFKREQGLDDGDAEAAAGADFDDEIDLRAEDDALIAAELDAAEAAREDEAEDEPEDAGDDGCAVMVVTTDRPVPSDVVERLLAEDEFADGRAVALR